MTARPNARFKVTVSEQLWRMWDIEVEVDPEQPWLLDLTDGAVSGNPGAAYAQETLLKMAVAGLQERLANGELPDAEDQESGDFSFEGFDVIVSPHDATVLDLLALREELT